MLCPNCSTEVWGIRDDNAIWCDNCGTAIKEDVQYVTGYCQSHACRTQPYCRVKRFGKYITKVTNDTSVLQHYHTILDLYSCFEYAWQRNLDKSTRVYFYAKPVLLRLCCDLLKLEPQNLPALKDKQRENDQIQELGWLRSLDCWQSMYAVKTGGEQPEGLKNDI